MPAFLPILAQAATPPTPNSYYTVPFTIKDSAVGCSVPAGPNGRSQFQRNEPDNDIGRDPHRLHEHAYNRPHEASIYPEEIVLSVFVR